VPPVAARQTEVARDYLKRVARIDELNGHPLGSDGPMATALKRSGALDLDFGVTGAGPAERKERTAAGVLRAEKKKVELPLGLSRRVCFADCRFA